jgi:histidyl-tRNA synthetase
VADIIRPRTLKGFRDFLPEAAIARGALIATAIDVFCSYGYSPIDTPVLEYAEVLLGKGGAETEKQTYRFDDHGGRDVAMRFDLTVPFARFAAQHIGELGTPFKRYHVGAVWRGENTQRGRYREFVQCDFDTIGTESALADIDTLLVTHDLFTALGFTRFSIRVNDRRVLNGLLERLGLGEHATEVLRALDKVHKIGIAKVAEELAFVPGADESRLAAILDLAGLQGTNEEVLAALPGFVAGSATGEAGVAALGEIASSVLAAGADPTRIVLDLSIARGLDYYTGMVFETFLDDLPDIGSCASGGRYDDLASMYTKQRLPGVGGSLGVDRLLAAMEELGLVDGRRTTADVLVTVFDDQGRMDALTLAADLRRAGIAAEVYPDQRKLGAQLKYADRSGHRLALIAGPDERKAGTVQVKDLASGGADVVPRTELVAACRRRL